ncbi:hypothetical protein K7X08_007197 [Anisodus acutangulus]|uniref:DnaJ homologue subfamily C member 28 conserved domain-containing protein n=2 Tax=Anisodus TaxID=243963 RepID=A0A9Q1LDK4_9SOLA|nr:hypothetical protein K7X08_007197 [Anisodus acutangulus]KAK4345623.1 hypothetical protein RND71_035799 [Anisodus tanguticus]
MAARFTRSIGALSYSATHKSTAGIETISHEVYKPRLASSSSSSPESQFPKSNNKKMSDRLSGVIDAVNDRKLPPELRGQRDAVRSETDIINVVEQRIWHSMEEGQFENLPGKGKPLDLNTNPHADPAEDTLYRILSKNKCAPEWVELNKEIRNNVAEWRSALKKAWTHSGSVGDSKWIEASGSLKLRIRDINNKVFRYNLIVPFGRQMLGLKWEKEIDRLKEESTGG